MGSGITESERNLDIDSTMLVEEALTKLNLLKDTNLTNATILLFGNNPQKFFLQAKTNCARFKGTEAEEFIDMKVFEGNIIDQREDAVEFVRKNIKSSASIVGTERLEKWEYPIEAIREAITNAVCHRDYQLNSNVQVRVFDDKLEIWGAENSWNFRAKDKKYTYEGILQDMHGKRVRSEIFNFLNLKSMKMSLKDSCEVINCYPFQNIAVFRNSLLSGDLIINRLGTIWTMEERFSLKSMMNGLKRP